MNRVKELKKMLEEQEKQDLEEKHKTDLIELEETHIQEFNEFNAEWDKQMNEFQQHSGQLIQALAEKQDIQLQEYRKQLDETTPNLFKPSPQLIELKTTQVNLAKQKDYQQAHKIQIKANKLEVKEQEKYAYFKILQIFNTTLDTCKKESPRSRH